MIGPQGPVQGNSEFFHKKDVNSEKPIPKDGRHLHFEPDEVCISGQTMVPMLNPANVDMVVSELIHQMSIKIREQVKKNLEVRSRDDGLFDVRCEMVILPLRVFKK